MATKKPEVPAVLAPPAANAKPEPLDMRGKVAAALDGKDDYVYVEVKHEGQIFAAWRSRNGDVHIENRGA